jgi:hypothetical protein
MESKARHEAATKGLPYYLEHGNRSTRKQPNWCSRQDCEFMPYRITATGELPEGWQKFGRCNHTQSCGYRTGWPNAAAPLPDPEQYRPQPYVKQVQTKFLDAKLFNRSVKQLDHIASCVKMHTRKDLFRKWWKRSGESETSRFQGWCFERQTVLSSLTFLCLTTSPRSRPLWQKGGCNVRVHITVAS